MVFSSHKFSELFFLLVEEKKCEMKKETEEKKKREGGRGLKVYCENVKIF